MSDQPNPTTGEVCGFTGDTIPTTDEWTWQYVDSIEDACPDNERPSQWIANAHNAALAAAFKRGKLEGVFASPDEGEVSYVTGLERELAAERELRNKLDAVERDKRDFEMFRNIIPAGEPTPDNPTTGEWTPMCLAKFYAAGQLQEQQLCDAIKAALAAERERVTKIMATDASRKEKLLREQLAAREAIYAWHGDVAWEIYEKHSPEMKMIDAALEKIGGNP